MNPFLHLMILALPFSSHGGTEVGNGGNAVVCFSTIDQRNKVRDVLMENKRKQDPFPIFSDSAVQAAIKSVGSLDLYLYQLPRDLDGWTRPIVTWTGTPKDLVERAITRLETKTEGVKFLREALAAIPYKNWRARTGVPTIEDSDFDGYLNPECIIAQIAHFKNGLVDYDSFLFNRLDDVNKAALILHELFYFLDRRDFQAVSAADTYPAVGLTLSDNELNGLYGNDLNVELKPISCAKDFNRCGVLTQTEYGEMWLDRDYLTKPALIKGKTFEFVANSSFERMNSTAQFRFSKGWAIVRGVRIDFDNATVVIDQSGDAIKISETESAQFIQGIVKGKFTDLNVEPKLIQVLFSEGTADIQGKSVAIKNATYDTNWNLMGLQTYNMPEVTVWSWKINMSSVILFDGFGNVEQVASLGNYKYKDSENPVGLDIMGGRFYFKIGVLDSITGQFPFDSKLRVRGETYEICNKGYRGNCFGEIRFFSDQSIQAVSIESSKTFYINRETIEFSGVIEFHRNGALKSGSVAYPVIIQGRSFQSGDRPEFDDQGRLLP